MTISFSFRSFLPSYYTSSEAGTAPSPTPAQQGAQEASSSSSAPPRRDRLSRAFYGLLFGNGKNANEPQEFALTELPVDVQKKIIHQMDLASIAKMRLTSKAFKSLVSEAVPHVTVKNREELRQAIETYKKGGITPFITVTDPGFTDDDLLLLQDFPGLKRLNLKGCTRLTDAGLAHLRFLTNLQELNLERCWKLTKDGKQYLRKQLRGCKVH